MTKYALLTLYCTIYSLMTLGLILAFPGVASGQCQLTDDYSDPSRWTQVGSLMEVTAGSAIFGEYCPDGEQRRIHAPLGTTLFEESAFVADIDFQVLDIGAIPFPSVGHIILALTAGTQEPLSACPDIACTGNPTGDQDGIMVLYATPDQGEGDVHFRIVVKDGEEEL
ncbi:MAG: hypothetical protein R3330_08155, partial [Saprospiraceae bacterium]|nr:hypothetical protein [Saprospiraceae bacterium]